MKNRYVISLVGILVFGVSLLLLTNAHADTPVRGEILLIPDSTSDTIGMYNPYNGTYMGDIINASGMFTTPINAILGPDGNIYVSDQVEDAVFVFDISGTYLYTYANESDGLDNIRGISFYNGNLFVTDGNNQCVAEFNGPHSRLPDFINDGSTPFDILFLDDGRALLSDMGVDDNVRLYYANGTLDNELFKVNFPEQLQIDPLLPGGFLVGSFNDDVAIDFELDGTIIQNTSLDSCRGVYRLGNGNLLLTNGNGVYEIENGTGTIIDTENSGGSYRFIELVTLQQNFVYIDENKNKQFDAGEWNGTSIQAAVDNASSDDIIYVWNGTYYENNITIGKPLTIIGNTTVEVNHMFSFNGFNYSWSWGISYDGRTKLEYFDVGFWVTADHVNISGFMINGSIADFSGIHLQNAHYCNISSNVIQNDPREGICLNNSHYNTIYNNIIRDNGIGIYLINASNNYMSNNLVTGNAQYGIYHTLYDMYRTACHNIIHENVIWENNLGILMTYTDNETITSNLICHNQEFGINCFEVYNSRIADNLMVLNGNGLNRGGINIMNDCDNITIHHNLIKGSDGEGTSGISIRPMLAGSNNIIQDNYICNYSVGIYLCGTDNETITQNDIQGNIDAGVYAEYCENIMITNNNISYNGPQTTWPNNYQGGIVFERVNHSTISGNYFTRDVGGAIVFWQSHYINITENDVINNCGYIQGIGLLDDSTHIYVRFNNILNNTGPGIRVVNNEFTTIESNVIKGNPTGIEVLDSNYTYVEDNVIAHNHGNTGISIHINSNHTVITDNIIKDNDCGIYVYGGPSNTGFYYNVDTEIHWNLIYNNSEYGLQYYMVDGGTPYINATYNWWGSANGPNSIDWSQQDPVTFNYASGYGDLIDGGYLNDNIHFDPWLGLMLYQGWNMITPAFIVEGPETAEELGQLIDDWANTSVCTVVTMWDNLQQKYISHIVGYGFDYNLTYGYGYFVYVTQNVNMNYDGGIDWQNINITLYTGYNMIGWPYPWYITASWLADNITNCIKVAKWDEETQLWLPEYIETLPIPYDFDIQMAEGTFVFITDGPVTWQYWPPS